MDNEIIKRLEALESRLADIERRLSLPPHEVSEWQIHIMEKLNQVLEYYHTVPFRREMTMEMLLDEVKNALLYEYGCSFDECKDFYLMRFPHTKPTDFEIIEENEQCRILYERYLDTILKRKHDRNDNYSK